jgi:hypothetical protein
MNRKTAILSFAAAGLLTIAIILLTPRAEGGDIPSPPSTFYATHNGARAIYRVLQQLLPEARQWRLPLTELERSSRDAHATLIVMGPQRPLSKREADALDTWILNGGQLVLATTRTWDIDNPGGSASEKRQRGDYLARHKIYRRPGEGARAVAASETRPVGMGRIVYVPDDLAFSNQTLRTTDNAVWLATQVSEWGEKALFDEYHHGFAQRRGFFTLVGSFLIGSPWGLVCLQLALAGVVYLIGHKRRFGKVVQELPAERTSPIEAAEALGGLFRTAQARVLSARAIHQYLNSRLSVLLGHRVDLSQPESRERIARRSRMGRPALDAYAKAVENALGKSENRDEDLVRIARIATEILRSLEHAPAANRRHAAAG